MRHEWKDPVEALFYAVTEHEKPAGDVRDVLRREILRLAERVKLLEAGIDINAHLDIQRLTEREKALREALRPAMRAFQERAGSFERNAQSGAVMAERITLTAEFFTEALRALLKEEE
jgi:hypothetical protein